MVRLDANRATAKRSEVLKYLLKPVWVVYQPWRRLRPSRGSRRHTRQVQHTEGLWASCHASARSRLQETITGQLFVPSELLMAQRISFDACRQSESGRREYFGTSRPLDVGSSRKCKASGPASTGVPSIRCALIGAALPSRGGFGGAALEGLGAAEFGRESELLYI